MMARALQAVADPVPATAMELADARVRNATQAVSDALVEYKVARRARDRLRDAAARKRMFGDAA